MLRTFCSNPGLGGFGNESTFQGFNDTNAVVTPDAFCQIIKELVDNAVDACSVGMSKTVTNTDNDKIKLRNKKINGCDAVSTTTSTVTTANRVRVTIERFMERKDATGGNDNEQELLKVTVSDNGCGMNDIQACVGAFHTSKVDYKNDHDTSKSSSNEERTKKPDETAKKGTQTAGRYGIGLTLCLLHAQRLVPDSSASIQSATTADREWTVVSVTVDTALDIVRCSSRKKLPKSTPAESGTAVSILVPGGPSATIAWPRLVEYFARFKLSLDMTCSVEVLAPTLSRVPLWIHPNDMDPVGCMSTRETTKGKKSMADRKKIPIKENGENVDFTSANEGNTTILPKGEAQTTLNHNTINRERLQIWKATQTFLGRPIDLANVAHASVPIRIESSIPKKRTSKKASSIGPRLVVDVIVHGSDNMEDVGDELGNNTGNKECFDSETTSSKSSSMMLIRMVNKIPLLDSAEAAACGLVYGIASKKRMWNSFGLEVNMNIDSGNANATPTFGVRDSDQVLPFLNQGAHSLLEYYVDSESDDETEVGTKRKRHGGGHRLLPVSLRLGSILIFVHIHAEPATLPLPTLCKGRLPIGNKSIDDALEVGITQCLQQLQKTNPTLLLTAAQLRKAECDARYVPSASFALASILSNSINDTDRIYIDKIINWNVSDVSFSSNFQKVENKAPLQGVKVDEVHSLSMLIERRLRLVMTNSTTVTKLVKGKKPPAEEDKGDSCAHNSASDVDTDDEFRKGDFLTASLQTDKTKLTREVKCDVDEDCDFDLWL